MGTFITGINLSSDSRNLNTLEAVCEILPSKAKIAMYKAASARKISQRTWNRCAFNGAGIVVGTDNIRSEYAAALVFGCTEYTVKQFIGVWDSYVSDDPTGDLRITLEKVGLFTNPTDKIRVIDENAQTEFIDSLEQEFELEPIDEKALELLLR